MIGPIHVASLLLSLLLSVSYRNSTAKYHTLVVFTLRLHLGLDRPGPSDKHPPSATCPPHVLPGLRSWVRKLRKGMSEMSEDTVDGSKRLVSQHL